MKKLILIWLLTSAFGLWAQDVMKPQGSIYSLDFDESGQILWIGSDAEYPLGLNLQDLITFLKSQRHDGPIGAVLASSDSRVFSGSFQGSLKAEVRGEENNSLFSVADAHNDYIRSLSISPNGNVLASASDDAVINLWDSKTGILLHTLTGAHSDYIRSIQFLSDTLLVAVSDDERISLWNTESGRLIKVFVGHTDYIRMVVSLGDGRFITGGDDNAIKLWDSQGILINSNPQFNDWVMSLAVDLEGGQVFVGLDDGTVYRVSLADFSGKPTLVESSGSSILSIDYFPSGSLLAFGTEEGSLLLKNLEEGNTIKSFQFQSAADSDYSDEEEADFHYTDIISHPADSNQLLAGGTDGSITSWEIESGILTKQWMTPQGVSRVLVSPDYLIALGNQGLISLFPWETESGGEIEGENIAEDDEEGLEGEGMIIKQPLYTYNVSGVDLLAGDFHPEENLFVAGGDDGNLYFITISEQGLQVESRSGHDDYIRDLIFLPSGDEVVTASDDGDIKLWNVKSKDVVKVFTGHTDYVRDLVYNPLSGKLFSGSDDSFIKVWNIDSLEAGINLVGHSEYVMALDISDDGKFIASGDDEGYIIVWDGKTGRTLHFNLESTSVNRLLFLPESHKFVHITPLGNTIHLWDAVTGEAIKTFGNSYVPTGLSDQGEERYILSIDITEDGKWLVSGDSNGGVRYFNWETKEILWENVFHSDYVREVEFHPNGIWIASGSDDGKVVLWDRQTGEIISIMQDHPDYVRSIEFVTKDGQELLLSGCDDGLIRVFLLPQGTLVNSVSAEGGYIYSLKSYGDGNLIAGTELGIKEILLSF